MPDPLKAALWTLSGLIAWAALCILFWEWWT